MIICYSLVIVVRYIVLKCYELPEFSRQSKGVPIVNILPLEKGEVINAIIPVKKEDDSKYLIFFTC